MGEETDEGYVIACYTTLLSACLVAVAATKKHKRGYQVIASEREIYVLASAVLRGRLYIVVGDDDDGDGLRVAHMSVCGRMTLTPQGCMYLYEENFIE